MEGGLFPGARPWIVPGPDPGWRVTNCSPSSPPYSVCSVSLDMRRRLSSSTATKDPPPGAHTPHPQAGVPLPGQNPEPVGGGAQSRPFTSSPLDLLARRPSSGLSFTSPHLSPARAPPPTNSHPSRNSTAARAQTCWPVAPVRGGPNLFQAMMSYAVYTALGSRLLSPTPPHPIPSLFSQSILCLALINWFRAH